MVDGLLQNKSFGALLGNCILVAVLSTSIVSCLGGAPVDEEDTPLTRIAQLGVSNASASEGSQISFSVTLSRAVTSETTFIWSTSAGTASSGADYTAVSLTRVTFAAGSSSTNLIVQTIEDLTDEPNETLTVALSSLEGDATISGGSTQATGTIIDNDLAAEASLEILPSGSYNFGSAIQSTTITATFTLTNSGGSQAVSLTGSGLTGNFDFVGGSFPGGGTCTDGGNLNSLSTCTFLVQFTPSSLGYFSAQVDIDYNNSSANQTSSKTLGGAGVSVANIIISDGPTYDYGSVVVGATASKTFIVSNGGGYLATSLSGSGLASPFEFVGGTFPGGGTCVNDGQLDSGSTCTVLVDFIPDFAVGYSDEFIIDYNNGTGAASGSRALTATGSAAPTPQISVSDDAIVEGQTALIYVTVDFASASDITVNYVTSDGTATQPDDYTPIPTSTLTIPAGNTYALIAVETIDDDLDEANTENFTLDLSAATNASLADAQGNISLTDNDSAPSIAISDAAAIEGSAIEFLVTLTAASGQDITFQWSTSDGSATTANSDYVAVTASSVTMVAGTTSTTLSVSTTQDAATEPDETFSVNLSNIAKAGTLDANATGTITNDDTGPNITIDDRTVLESVGNATLTVSLSSSYGTNITIDYATNEGLSTATGSCSGGSTSKKDYTCSVGTITISAGSQTASINIPILQNSGNPEASGETVVVDIFNASDGAITDSQGIISITDVP